MEACETLGEASGSGKKEFSFLERKVLVVVEKQSKHLHKVFLKIGGIAGGDAPVGVDVGQMVGNSALNVRVSL